MNDSTALWWVIKGPVVGSIMVSVFGREGKRWGPGLRAAGREVEGPCTNWLPPLLLLHYIVEHGCTNYLAIPLWLGVDPIPFFFIIKVLLGIVLYITLSICKYFFRGGVGSKEYI